MLGPRPKNRGRTGISQIGATEWGDLLEGKQIFVKDLREFNALYVAARRKGVQTRRFKLSNARFAVIADGLYDRKIEFIAAGNVYYTRRKELTCLLKAAAKAGICLDHSAINKSANPQILRVRSANKDKSGVQTSLAQRIL